MTNHAKNIWKQMKNQSNKYENTHAHHEKHEAHAGTEHKFAYAFTHVSCFSLYFACCSSCFFMCLLQFFLFFMFSLFSGKFPPWLQRPRPYWAWVKFQEKYEKQTTRQPHDPPRKIRAPPDDRPSDFLLFLTNPCFSWFFIEFSCFSWFSWFPGGRAAPGFFLVGGAAISEEQF